MPDDIAPAMTSDNPLAGFLAELDAEGLKDQARIEDLLEPYRDNQDAATRFGNEAKKSGAKIKEWLALNPGLDLYDDKGFHAYLQTRL